jgi:hypothetical protein
MYLGVFIFSLSLSASMVFNASVILPYVCPVFRIKSEYPEWLLLFLFLVHVLYIWSKMFGPFALPILVRNPRLHSFTHSLTHSLMELSPSWEAANCAATRELPIILWNRKVHRRVHMSPTYLLKIIKAWIIILFPKLFISSGNVRTCDVVQLSKQLLRNSNYVIFVWLQVFWLEERGTLIRGLW